MNWITFRFFAADGPPSTSTTSDLSSCTECRNQRQQQSSSSQPQQQTFGFNKHFSSVMATGSKQQQRDEAETSFYAAGRAPTTTKTMAIDSAASTPIRNRNGGRHWRRKMGQKMTTICCYWNVPFALTKNLIKNINYPHKLISFIQIRITITQNWEH